MTSKVMLKTVKVALRVLIGVVFGVCGIALIKAASTTTLRDAVLGAVGCASLIFGYRLLGVVE